MKRNILVFGAIAGIIVSAFMATSMAIAGCSSSSESSMATGMVIGFSSMAVAFSFIFVAIKNFRDKQNGGVVTFGQAFKMGLVISLIASTMYVLTWGVQFHYFLPDFLDKYTAMEMKNLQSSFTGVELDQKIKELEETNFNYKNNFLFFSMYTYMEILPVGILITLISALILRRKTAKKELATEIENL